MYDGMSEITMVTNLLEFYMESRRNASPSIETLKSNSTEDDTCGKKSTRETSKSNENSTRSAKSTEKKNRRHTKMHSFVTTYEGDNAIQGTDPQSAIS